MAPGMTPRDAFLCWRSAVEMKLSRVRDGFREGEDLYRRGTAPRLEVAEN
jgi:hypothetical protein